MAKIDETDAAGHARRPPSDVTPDIREIGFLRTLPRETATRLVSEATRLELPTGSTFYNEQDSRRFVAVVLKGLLRVFTQAPDGRQVTFSYGHPGDVVGLPLLFAVPTQPSLEDAAIQAVMPTAIAVLRFETLRQFVHVDVDVTRALATELSYELYRVIEELAGNAFLSVRERIGRHLVHLAVPRRPDDLLVARVTQQELADAVASVRTVVGRTLQQMRREEIIATSRDEIIVLDPLRARGGSSHRVAAGP